MTNLACARARLVLWPGQGPRPASPDVVAAQEHVAGCAGCSAFFAEQAALGALVRQADRRSAPEALRRRVLAMARGDRRPARLKVALVAAAAVVIVAGAVALWRPTAGGGVSERTILSLFTAEHQRLVAGGGISSGDAAQVTRWFAGRVDFALHVPEFTGGALRGGRLCMADGHRGAIVEYEFEGHMVSYFVLPVAVRGAPAELRHATQAGYRVVWWVQDGLLHGVVGGLPADRLEQLAKWCRDQWRAVIAFLPQPLEEYTMRTFIASAVSGLVLLAAAPLAAQEQKAAATQPAAVTITADVIDLSCRLVNKASGASHRECAQVCADKGQPLALMATDGTIYVPVNAGMGAAGENARLRAHAEHRVRVKGRVIEQGSFKAIVIETIEMTS